MEVKILFADEFCCLDTCCEFWTLSGIFASVGGDTLLHLDNSTPAFTPLSRAWDGEAERGGELERVGEASLAGSGSGIGTALPFFSGSGGG